MTDKSRQQIIDELVAVQEEVSTKVGNVAATPTANTVLGRLKSVEDKLDALDVFCEEGVPL